MRVENAQRVSGEVAKNWDHREVMDATTNHVLSYAGVRCRVLGTFYVGEHDADDAARAVRPFLRLGSEQLLPQPRVEGVQAPGSYSAEDRELPRPAPAYGLPYGDPRTGRCCPLRVDQPSFPAHR